MASSQNTYDLQDIDIKTGYRFLFISEGVEDILKAVRYTFIDFYEKREVYNLAFGDYNFETDAITDLANSNNGDVYKVLQTVLKTIPYFFERKPNAIILVQGSDSRLEFAEECRKKCSKRCVWTCKKLNQRIKIYRSYVERNFEDLSQSHWFLGGFVSGDSLNIEKYKPGGQYDAILLFRK